VLALLGDGGALYTNQALWTQARENLPVVTVVFSNRAYHILDHEYRRLGVNDVGARAASLFSLERPALDFVALARSMGVPGERVDTVFGLRDALGRALAGAGPGLVEALV
jgi:acetolactate synthase-1/2/3 large subunit